MNIEGALINPEWPVRRVMEQINRFGQGISVVVDQDGCLISTVTDGDIRRALLAGMSLDNPVQALLDRRPAAPHPDPLFARVGTPDGQLLRMMNQYGLRHVPLVDAAGKVVDIALLTNLVKEYELPLTAVVMAGGYGTRLRPLTDKLPKPMLPVGDRPLLELTIEKLRKAGIRRVNLATHYQKDVISQHFGDGHGFGVGIQYVEEDQPLGTAGALGLLNVADEPLLVINGDILTGVDFRTMLDFHSEHRADMTVAVRQQEFRLPFGVVDTDGVVITGIREKPVVWHFINAGIYLLSPEVCRSIPNGQPCDMPDLIARSVADGRRVVSFPVHEYWMDIGQVEDYERAQDYVDRGSQ